MRIAIFGGSFNPIHNAHIKLALRFLDENNLDIVYFVPTYTTPLKDNTDVISAVHRFNMCEIALSRYDNLFVSDVEIKREGMSYSSDTIAYFKDQFKDAELFFIMGADMFMTLTKWHNFEYIFENVTILTAPRDNVSYSVLSSKLNEYSRYLCKACISSEYIEDLSSTMLRDMLKNNLDVSAYLNKEVIEYIAQNNLYR